MAVEGPARPDTNFYVESPSVRALADDLAEATISLYLGPPSSGKTTDALAVCRWLRSKKFEVRALPGTDPITPHRTAPTIQMRCPKHTICPGGPCSVGLVGRLAQVAYVDLNACATAASVNDEPVWQEVLKELGVSTAQGQSTYERFRLYVQRPEAPWVVVVFDGCDALLPLPAVFSAWVQGVRSLSKDRYSAASIPSAPCS